MDPTLENSDRKMEDGRPSQSVTALLSHGMASGAFEQLLAVHFLDPSTDALSAEAQLQYDTLRQGALPQPFCDKLLKAITERVATLPRGIGAGPSGHRYEHLRAISGTSTGRVVVPQLLLIGTCVSFCRRHIHCWAASGSNGCLRTVRCYDR